MDRRIRILVPALAASTLMACAGTTALHDGPDTQYGTPVAVGNGHARAYVTFDDQAAGTPIEIGIALDEQALDGLPAAGADPSNPMSMYSFLLPVPAGMPAPYQVVELNWNAGGHPPPGVYDTPHFDFHFYTVSLDERNAILPSDPDFATKAAHLPQGEFVPPRYAVLPPPPAPTEAVPMMGVHWLDVSSPELQPPTSPAHHAFTRTFIYGSWDGQFTFVEPMVALTFLQSHPDETTPISTPSDYAVPGYYPTTYRVTYDAQTKETHVALTGLTLRQ